MQTKFAGLNFTYVTLTTRGGRRRLKSWERPSHRRSTLSLFEAVVLDRDIPYNVRWEFVEMFIYGTNGLL